MCVLCVVRERQRQTQTDRVCACLRAEPLRTLYGLFCAKDNDPHCRLAVKYCSCSVCRELESDLLLIATHFIQKDKKLRAANRTPGQAGARVSRHQEPG